MPAQPIRSLIARALEKQDQISDFVAFPVLYQIQSERPNPRTNFGTEIFEVASHFGDATVTATWHTAKTVEVALSNGLQVSIEIVPPTFAMRVIPEWQSEQPDVIPLTLISHEDTKATAQTVESRIHALRQVYAIAVIAFDLAEYQAKFRGVDFGGKIDFENFIDEEDKLVLISAGEGSWWVAVKAAWATAKKAPKAAVVATSALFGRGKQLFDDYAKAIVKAEVAKADKATAEAESGEIQNEVAAEKAKQMAAQSAIETQRLQLAADKERQELEIARQNADINLEKQKVELATAKFALDKSKMDTFLDIYGRIDQSPDAQFKEKAKAELMSNTKLLLGTTDTDGSKS